jgi:hypothetical protein
MTALPVPHVRTAPLMQRLRDLSETIYSAPAPKPGPGLAAKATFTAYVVGSALAWGLAAILVTGLLASLFR